MHRLLVASLTVLFSASLGATPVPYASESFLADIRGNATGFFHVEETDGRPVLIDPLGRGFYSLAVDRVQWCGERCEKLGYSPYERHNEATYGDRSEWAAESLGRLRDWGFNTLGAGCDAGLLRRRGLVHAQFLGIGNSMLFGDEDQWICEDRHAPCTFFPNVFYPDFAKKCETVAAKACPPNRDDPWLLGYYIDNELAWWGRGSLEEGLFDAVMAKPETHSAKRALRRFLAGRPVSATIKREFLALAAERYFACTTAAIRKYDPNHLVLGCRFAGFGGAHDVVWEVAGRHSDLVTFNLYPWADLDRNVVLDQKGGRRISELLSERFARTKKPIIVTEWSFPALDAGRPCLHGGGQRFRTQGEREAASELMARTLLAQPGVVGYGYFMWLDQPASGIRSTFPEDCNYGLVREDGSAYEGLTEMFRRLHGDVARIRAGGLPSGRPAANLPIAGEAERFRAECGTGESGVVFTCTGGVWRAGNGAGLVLKGRLGGLRMVDEISVGGRPVGAYGGMLKFLSGGSPQWLDAAKTTDVRFEPARGNTPTSVLCTSEGGWKRRFRLVHRLWLSPRTDDFVAEVVSVENLSDEPLEVVSFFCRAFALDGTAIAESRAPSLWKAEPESTWSYPDGRRLKMRSRDAALRSLRFWREANGTQHPDAEFAVPGGLTVAPGAVCRPTESMSVRISEPPAVSVASPDGRRE